MNNAPEIDPAAEAQQQAVMEAEIKAQQQAAMVAAQETAIDDADDDGQDLAELAAEESDPLDDDVEDTDNADEDSDDTTDTEDAVTDSNDGDAGTGTTAEDNDSDGNADTTDIPTEQTGSTDTDSAATDTEDAARDTDGDDSAPAADAGTSTDDDAATMAVQSISGFQQRLHDECARRGVTPASDRQEAYAVRRELEEERKRGVEMGLLDPAAMMAFDAEMEYSDSTLSEDQRNSHGPGSPMYEEARRLGYIRDDRTQRVSSMRLREDDVARRQANDRWRFNHYWQQQAALSRIGALKTVMIAQDSDSGSRAGFVQLGAIVVGLSIGDGIDDADVEAYIAAQEDAAQSDVAQEDAVQPDVAQHSASSHKVEDSNAASVQQAPVAPPHVERDIMSASPEQSVPEPVPVTPTLVPTAHEYNNNTQKDTHVEIQEFIAAWNEFTDVERRIVLLRTGLVDANDMEQMYTQMQETVTSRTNERDRFQAECDRLRADLEYETHARRDVERELAKLRGQGQPAQE